MSATNANRMIETKAGSVKLPDKLRITFWISIGLILILSLLDLLGWLFDITFLKSMGPNWIAMKVTTAVCFILTTVALAVIFMKPNSRRILILPVAIGIILITVSLLTTICWFHFKATGNEASISTFRVFSLFLTSGHRMALLTASIFIFTGVILILLTSSSRVAGNIAHILSFPTATAGYLIPVSYLLNAYSFHQFLETPVALNSGFAFCAVFLSIFIMRPDTWLMRVFISKHSGGFMARRLIPWMLIIPVVIGWLRIFGEHSGFFISEVGVLLVAITYTFCFVLLIWFTGRSVNLIDTKRHIADQALKRSHEDLEIRVGERTAELTRLNKLLDQEISERINVEALVEAERKRFNGLLELMPAYLILLTPDYHVAYANRYFRERFGESNGKRCFEFLFGRSEPCEVCETFKTLQVNRPLTWEWTGPDGRKYSIFDFPYTDSDGSPLIMEMGIDVTSLKNAEAELKSLNADLELRVLERSSRLIESEKRYRLLVDSIPETSILLFDKDHRIKVAGGGELEKSGFNKSKIEGMTLEEAYPPEVVKLFAPLYDNAFDGKATTFEHDYKEYHYLQQIIPVFDKEGNINSGLVISTNITGRKKSEQKLQTILGRFNTVVSSIYGSILLVREDRIDLVNQSFCEYFGLKESPDELTGIGIAEMIDMIKQAYLNPEKQVRRIKEIIKEGKKVLGEEVPMHDGRTCLRDFIPIITDGKMRGRLWYHIDITERKKIENELFRSKQEWVETFDKIPDLIAIIDKDHRILRANRSMIEKLNGIKGPVEGSHCFHCVHGSSMPPSDCPHSKALIDGKQHIAEIHEEKLGGDFIVSDTPMFDGTGKYIGSVHVARDVTDLKKTGIEMEKLNQRLLIISDTSRRLLEGGNQQEMTRDLCNQVMKFLNCHVFFNFLMDEATGRLHLNSYTGVPASTAKKIEWLDLGGAICGCVARDGELIVAENIFETPDPRTDFVKSFGIQAYACHPLLSHDKVIGTLSFGTKTRTTFSEDDLSLMKIISDQVAIAMTRVRDIEMLRKSEERYRSLMELSPGASFVNRNDQIVMLNSAARKLLGARSTDEILGKSPFDIFHPDYHDVVRSRIESIMKGRTVPMTEEQIIRVDGSVRDVEVVAAGITDSEGPAIQVIMSDITERKKAERELSDTKNYLQNLIDYANAPIIVWDHENKIRLFNHAFEHLTGYTSAEVEGRKLDLLFPKSSLKESMAKIKRALTENWVTIEIPILTQKNDVRTVLWNSAKILDKGGKTYSTIAQGNDITERINAERAFKESKEKLEIALENGNIGTWEWDIMTNSFRWDERMEKMFGRKPGSFEGTYDAFEKSIHEDDVSNTRNAFRKALDENIPLDTIYRIKHLNDVINYISTKALVERDENGSAIKMSGVCFDITEMKQGAEKVLFRLNEELLRSNKELEQFAYVASHDLQEPLRMVSSFTQLLEQRYKDKLDRDARDFIKFAVDGAVRMQVLINDLLDYSRIGTRGKEFSSIDMHTVLGQVVNNLKIIINEKSAIITNDKIPIIKADEGQMVQLMQNIIGNSLKFCRESPKIHVSSKVYADHYLFSVRDNGIGIEPQYYEKIFQIFQRLHPRDEFGGTGIGLAISKRIVERHGGNIWVESKKGKGSIFYFTILKR